MSGTTYWQWGIPIAVLLSLAVFVAWVFIAERSQERELPRTPAQRQAPEGTDTGAPRPGPPREREVARR